MKVTSRSLAVGSAIVALAALGAVATPAQATTATTAQSAERATIHASAKAPGAPTVIAGDGLYTHHSAVVSHLTLPVGALRATVVTSWPCSSLRLRITQGKQTLAVGAGSSGLTVVGRSTSRFLVAWISTSRCHTWVRVTVTREPTVVRRVSLSRLARMSTTIGDSTTYPVSGTNIPRGPDQLIIYTRLPGQTVTPTNRYGAEATIVGGVVTSLRDRQTGYPRATPIPANGYVLSGNRAARLWMLNTLTVGTSIAVGSSASVQAPVVPTTPTTTDPAPAPTPTTTAPAPAPSTTTTDPAPAPSTTTTDPAPAPSTTTTTPAPAPSTTTTDPAPAPSTTTTDPAPAPTTTAPATPTYSVLSFGAVGDGVTDDTAAIQKALNSLKVGDTLVFPAGQTFVHTATLNALASGVRLTGGGTLLATNEASSAFHLGGNDMTVDNLTFKMGVTTKRWDTFEQMKLRVGWGTSNITISNVTIDGSAAAGLYIGGVTGFTLTDVTVQNTRADAIHMTGGSSNGAVIRPTVRNPGDDGVAVVSYKNDGAICHNITVTSPHLYGQQWGRAFSVVGGTDITETDVYSDGSNAAAIYIAGESEYNTYGDTRVTFDGGTLVNSNTNAAVDHGAVMVYSSQTADTPNTDITVKNLTIKDTRLTASRQVGVIQYGTAVQSHVAINNITIIGGAKWLYGSNAPATTTDRSGWTWNGTPVANALGW